MRQRLAPIDIRTETSCARVAARASSRLATFAQAIGGRRDGVSHRGKQRDDGPANSASKGVETKLEIAVGVGILVRKRRDHALQVGASLVEGH